MRSRIAIYLIHQIVGEREEGDRLIRYYRAGAFAIRISYLMRYSPAAVMGRHSGV